MTKISFFSNACPYCGCNELEMIEEENEERKLKCEKCKKTFEVSKAKRVKVGDTKSLE